MSTLSVRLPDSLHRRLKELAEKDGVSINQFIALAVAEKISALTTAEYLQERASRGSREKFDAVLSKAPAHAPQPGDELP
jgi:predicted transcriptional regulator